ncbi:MAG TPA: hypothetical protein VK484_00245 [Ferruginibacter sp.]|nr:hypothetical protein [Ferruginibacter sp.]
MSETNSLPTGSHFITQERAVEMTSEYRSNKEAILATGYQNQGILPLSETFNRGEIDTLLGKSGCEGLRIYYGMDENLKVHAIIIPVNEDNEDILPGENAPVDNSIVEEGQRCPDLCPPESPLNE